MGFSELGLGENVLRAVADAGYTTPTPIQEQAIPHILTGRDLLGCAQTGTGKTASFTLPMIEILAAGRAKARMPRSLILEPTRELAAQVADNFETYGKYHKLSKVLLIGGESMVDQLRQLDRGADVLIATPGRLLDVFDRGRLLLNDVRILVIDEADRMLDMGFIPDVERIVSLVSSRRQTLLFSATMPPAIRHLAEKFLSNPKEITVAPPATPAATVAQGLVVVAAARGVDAVNRQRLKRIALRQLIAAEEVRTALIFCNRKRDVGVVCRSLQRHGFDAAMLHGDMAQPARTEVLERLRRSQVTFLVCSDVAARGLDIDDLSHVFNFDVPTHAEAYVHRIGRTGRAGREGRALTVALPEDGKYVAAIEELIGKPIPRIHIEGVEAADLERPPRGRHRGRSESAGRSPPSQGRKGESPASKSSQPPRRGSEAAQAQPTSRKRERLREPEQPVVGMGDHTPAFLLREPVLAKEPPPRKKAKTA